MLNITRKEFINYTMLPGIGPRLRNLFTAGFQYIPFFIALVYQIVRLLPENHPYTNSQNIGRFGLRNVVAEAANNLVLSWKNIDQILLFGAILLGLVIVMFQICLLGFSLIFPPVMAAMPVNFAQFFITPNPEQDLAYIFLDMVFGIDGLFGSCVSLPAVNCLNTTGTPVTGSGGLWILDGLGWPFPIHEALHQMFQLYSTALLVVGAFITFYFIVTILIETAQTGQPFGKRFNKIWAPLRIVMAFGLLIPTVNGLNSAQYIVLYAAKFGSGFATNGWTLFNNTLTDTYLGDVNTLVAQPKLPELQTLLQFMFTVNTCARIADVKGEDPIRLYAVKDTVAVMPYRLLPIVGGLPFTDYQTLINFIDGESEIVLRWGRHNFDDYTSQFGHVKPICGELIIPLTDPRDPAAVLPKLPPNKASAILQAYYLFYIQFLWWAMEDDVDEYPLYFVQRYSHWDHDPNALLPDSDFKASWMEWFSDDLRSVITTGISADGANTDPLVAAPGVIQAAINDGSWGVTPGDMNKGWAAAGMWYNRLANLNGVVSAATFSLPYVSRYPDVMEKVYAEKLKQDQNIAFEDRFNPKIANLGSVPEDAPGFGQQAEVLWQAFKFWDEGGGTSTSHTAPTDNQFINALNKLMGTEGLFSMRENPDVHPLAQLVGVGRTLLQSSITNFGGSGILAGASATAGGDGMLKAGTSILWTLGMIGLTVGFVLFYVVPFLPFIYFFFAVGGWIKGIFEAMVGVPLWALAHLRIDGHGLSGPAALNGYFLIFEIFLRPILIIFGLLASISIFSALVSVMNQTWDLVVANLGGFDARTEFDTATPSMIEFMRGPVDEFFYTIVYTVIVYMMSMSSFKLIDLIPNNILRWMGQSVSTFNDSRQNPAEGLVGSASMGAQQAVGKIGGEGQKMVDSISGSDPALKENIELVDVKNGFNIYDFNYIWDSDTKYRGVMANEVLKSNPEAVSHINGYLGVYYDMIGLKMWKVKSGGTLEPLDLNTTLLLKQKIISMTPKE